MTAESRGWAVTFAWLALLAPICALRPSSGVEDGFQSLETAGNGSKPDRGNAIPWHRQKYKKPKITLCPEQPLVMAALRSIGHGPGRVALRRGQEKDVCKWKKVGCHGCRVEALFLKMANVSGSIEELAVITGLKRLNLLYTGITGDLRMLRNLTELRSLFLGGTKVTGDLAALTSPAFECLDLHGTNVTGDLRSLSHLRRMTRLRLHRTRVTGDLHALQEFKMLEELRLTEAGAVVGHLADLGKLTRLQTATLRGTQVSGNLKDLSKLTDLVSLNLRGLQISGRVGDLNGLAKFERLQLDHPQVSGDIGDLKRLKLLKEMHLRGTNVTGDIQVVRKLPHLVRADLSRTRVTGRLRKSWQGCCQHLRELVLADSQVSWLPQGEDARQLRKYDKRQNLLPALALLDVSRCPLNGLLRDFLEPLAILAHVGRIGAAGCNLSGELPDMGHIEKAEFSFFRFVFGWTSELSKSLQMLDLGNNSISSVEGLSARTYLNLASNGPVRLAPGVLQKALSGGVVLNLRGSSLVDRSEPRQLFESGILQRTDGFEATDERKGFACHGVDSDLLQVSPELFLPENFCGCLPGWAGASTSCKRCANDTYSERFNSSTCRACPAHSTSIAGSSSVEMCTCNFGKIHLDPTEGDYVCGCVEGQALQGRSCVPCLELHLNCSAPSAVAAKAPPLRGWARLEPATERTFRCLEPAEDRCRNGTALSACATGYDGPLCVICAPGFRSAGSLCKPCANFRQSRRGVLAFGAALSVAALVAGVVLWRRRAELAALAAPASPPPEPRARDAVLQLLCTAGPLLLQLGQLWVVVSALAMGARVESRVQEAEERSFSEAFKEQPYVQWLQLSAQGLQTALSLECSFGSVARTWAALVEPLAPLLLLALCGVVELFFRSAGIDLALKTVTLLFVGGATGCGNLLGCQEDDGGGNPLGKHHAFRVAMPELKCSDATWVAALGWLCAFAYGVLIPICLLGLMMKQHVTLQACRKTTAWAIKEGDRLVVRLHEFQGNAKAAAKDVPKEGGASEPRKLLAAAVAHAVVLFRGKVRMQMDDGGVTLELVQASENVAEPYDFSDMLLEIKSSSNAQRCNAITRMLMERSILEEAEKSDRVLAGARGHLAKYVWCQDVWVDIMMRLATVGLVSACSMEHSLGFSVGIPLVVGIMVGALQPYVQRQDNDLQCCCFICLAAAAVGFDFHLIWLARAALALPFVVLCCQIKHPDCPEALALRLFQALEPHLERAEPLEAEVEELRL